MADEGSKAGAAYVPITPDFRNFHTSIEKQLQGVSPLFAKAGADAGKSFSDSFKKTLGDPFATLKPPDQTAPGARAGGQFADAFRKRVTAALKALPDAKIDADSSPAERRIAQIRADLEELSGKKIGVDLSDAEALAKLKVLQAQLDEVGARSPSVRVRVDTGAASAELAGLAAEAGGTGGALSALGDAAGGGAGGLFSMATAAISLAPALVTIAAVAAGAAGALSAAGAAGAAGAGAFALVAVPAVSKIVTALQAQKTAQQQVTSATSSGTNTAAEHALAVDEIRQAEQSLTQAQQQQKTAEEALSAARVQARQDAIDLANSVTDAALTEKSDALSVLEARQALVEQDQQTAAAEAALADARKSLASAQGTAATVNADPNSTVAQKAAAAAAVAAAKAALQQAQDNATDQELAQKRAQLAVAQAVQALKEQKIASQRLQQQQDAASKAGIAGDKNVIAARNALRSADQQVESAELSLSRARLTAAQEATAASGGETAATVKARNALASLSGPQKTLLKAWQSLTTAYGKWAAPLQKPVLGVLTNGLKLAGKLLPALTPFVTGSAKAFDGLERSAGKALSGPFWASFAKAMSKLAPKAITGFGVALGDVATGLAGILLAFAPFAGPVLKGLDKLTAGFARWGQSLGKSSGFQSFMTYVKANGPAVASLLGNVVKIVVKLVAGFAPLGALIISALGPIAKFLAGLPPDKLLAIAAAVTVLLAAMSGGTILIIAAVVAVAAVIASKWKPMWKAVSGAVGVSVKAVKSWLGEMRKDWDQTVAYVEGVVTGSWRLLERIYGDGASAIKHGLSDFWSWIQAAFKTGVSAVGRVWAGLERVTKAPVNWVIQHVWDHGIEALWNKAAGIVHLPKLPDIPLLADGGILNRPTMAVVGEAGPEMVLPLSRPKRMAQLLGQAGIPMLADGGIFGSVGGFFSGAVKKVGGFIEGNLEHAFGALAGKLMEGLSGRIAGGAGPGSFGQIVAALPKAIVTGLSGFLGKKDQVPDGNVGGSGVTRWAPIIRFVLKALHQPAGDLGAVEHRMNQESGGNPKAINLWDSNAKAGDPSRGLMQTIGTTFDAYAGPYRSRGIYDPLANIYAGLNYAIHAYSKPLRDVMLQPGGYDDGGWMMPGYGAYVNATRKPEAVLTNAQWAAVSSATRGGDGASGDVFNLTMGDPRGTTEVRVRAAMAAAAVAQRRTLRAGRRK